MSNHKREYDKDTIENIQDKCLLLRNKNYSYAEISSYIKQQHNVIRTPETVSSWVKIAAERGYRKEGLGNVYIQTMRGTGELSDLLGDVDELLKRKYVEYSDLDEDGKTLVRRKELSQRAIVDLLQLKCNVLDKMNHIRGISNPRIQMQVLATQKPQEKMSVSDFQNLDPAVRERLQKLLDETPALN